MPTRWTKEQERLVRAELHQLYVEKNMTIKQIGIHLSLSDKTIFKRLQRLGIRPRPDKKITYRNIKKVTVPKHSSKLAEVCGVLYGDGHVSSYQIRVTLGSTERLYANYVERLIHHALRTIPRISTRQNGHFDVYVGSTTLVRFFLDEGLVHNKVHGSLRIPSWIFTKPAYMRSFVRGLFDTDGSIYKLRYGLQIEFTSKTHAIVDALHIMLKTLHYTPSKPGGQKIYITKHTDIRRFFRDIRPSNHKHLARYARFCVGTQAVNEDAL